MKVGLDYLTPAAELPSDADLFAHFLPSIVGMAKRMGIRDPEHAAADAVTAVVIVGRYQERWNANGTGKLEHYLYTMVLNRLRDTKKAQRRRLTRELVGVSYGAGAWDGETFDNSDDAVADPKAHQGYEAAELRASIPAMRAILASSDVPQASISLADLFEATAERTLRGESTSCRALGEHFGVSHSTIRLAQRRLHDLLLETTGA